MNVFLRRTSALKKKQENTKVDLDESNGHTDSGYAFAGNGWLTLWEEFLFLSHL